MSSSQDEKIQIVAFSTNDISQTPIDIINIFLGHQTHQVLKKARQAIAFSTNIKNSSKASKIMICSVLNLTREYTGITDVNCYIVFIDLENKDSLIKFNNIIDYAKENCQLTKKIFVLGMISGNEEDEIKINKSNITKILDNLKVKYEYNEINLSKIKEISDILMDILDYSSKHSIHEDEDEIDKEDGQARSCILF